MRYAVYFRPIHINRNPVQFYLPMSHNKILIGYNSTNSHFFMQKKNHNVFGIKIIVNLIKLINTTHSVGCSVHIPRYLAP